MKKAFISDQVLAGNMGEGWRDENEAADAFASFLEGKYRSLANRYFPEAEVVVDVEVGRNASGASRPASYVLINDDGESDYDRLFEDRCLSVGQVAWEEFCGSDQAAEIYEAE